jgi:hypothetical protein
MPPKKRKARPMPGAVTPQAPPNLARQVPPLQSTHKKTKTSKQSVNETEGTRAQLPRHITRTKEVASHKTSTSHVPNVASPVSNTAIPRPSPKAVQPNRNQIPRRHIPSHAHLSRYPITVDTSSMTPDSKAILEQTSIWLGNLELRLNRPTAIPIPRVGSSLLRSFSFFFFFKSQTFGKGEIGRVLRPVFAKDLVENMGQLRTWLDKSEKRTQVYTKVIDELTQKYGSEQRSKLLSNVLPRLF